MADSVLSTAIEQDPSLGLALCRLALGLDRLYRRARPAGGEAALAAEGLVPVDLWGGAPLALADWRAAEAAIQELASATPAVSDPVRQAYLDDTLRSLATTVAWQSGASLPFRSKAEQLLGVRIEPIPTTTLASWRNEVADQLTSEDTQRMPPEQLSRVTTDTLARAHALAAECMGAVSSRPLMELDLVHDVPYTAYCDYPANTIHLNADQAYSRARLELLLLHEAYPGHAYHLAWRERDVRLGRQPLDSLLVITNTPSSPLFEGIGDNGADFLDWRVPSQQRTLARLRSAACVNACLLLHEDGLSAEEVTAFLVEEGAGQPAWASTRVRFMQDPLRAPFVFAYFLGEQCVAAASVAWRGPRADFYACLYGQMHSPRSLHLAVERAHPHRSSKL